MSGDFSVGLADRYGEFWRADGLTFENALATLKAQWAKDPQATGFWSRPDSCDEGFNGCSEDEEEAFWECAPPRPALTNIPRIKCYTCGDVESLLTGPMKSREVPCPDCQT